MKNTCAFFPRSSALLLFLLGTLQAALPAKAQLPHGEDPVVMTINGEPVSAREYTLVMMRRASEVYSIFKDNQDLNDHAGYWNERPDSPAPSPIRHLRDKVKAELVRIKVTQSLAREKGLINDTTFAAFQETWRTENIRRLNAIKASEVVYGPRQYGETAYYYICFGELNHRLQRALSSSPEYKVTEKELEACYAANKSRYEGLSFSNVRVKLETIIRTANYEAMIDKLCAAAKVENDDTRLRALVPRHDN
ncbi:MAG: hypothetical protein K0R17_352 [Rariglobus sp.]|jgi:hypothetical protein|nr:hypothetical protein [Rariglobus sp.]